MEIEHRVLAAYHRAVGRHKSRTCVSYPITRESCVHLAANEDRGEIFDTDRFSPNLVATFTIDSWDRPRVRLV
jgi:hypothetical protein